MFTCVPRLSLTDFVDIASKAGTPRYTKVKEVKNRPPYSPASDFYKPLREGIVEAHEAGHGKAHLNTIVPSLTDPKKSTNYPAAIAAYKKWWGRKKLSWLNPTRSKFTSSGVEVTVNPELGLEINGVPHLIKLYFKPQTLAKNRVDIITHLMSVSLGTKVANGTVMGVLDVRRSKLICPTVPVPGLTPLLHAELAFVAALWPQV